jgi:hypothetical protein
MKRQATDLGNIVAKPLSALALYPGDVENPDNSILRRQSKYLKEGRNIWINTPPKILWFKYEMTPIGSCGLVCRRWHYFGRFWRL